MHPKPHWHWIGAGWLLAWGILAALFAALLVSLPSPAQVYASPSVDDPITGLTLTVPVSVPVGISASLSASVTTGTNVSYTWDFGDSGLGSGPTTSHTYTSPGNYTVTVTATNSISEVAAQALIQAVGDTPITGLSAGNDSPTLVGNATSFTATVTGGDNISYTWDFGDGAAGSGITPTHVYTASGSYTATVTAANNAGSQQTDTVVLVGDALVDVRDFSFDPDPVTILAGQRVIWTLRQGVHSVTADDGSFNQPAGSNWPPFMHQFTAAGNNPYFCTLHGAPGGVGMSGVVQVLPLPGSNTVYLPIILKP